MNRARERRRDHAPPGAQLQRDAGEVETQDLGKLPVLALGVLGGGPETHAATRAGAAGTARALLRRRAADAHLLEPIHAVACIEPCLAGEPGIDDRRHPIDGERGLGDVGREHDLTPRPVLDRPALLLERQIAVQGHDRDVVRGGKRRDGLRRLANRRGSGKEHRDVAPG